jgi:hypothetical protein
MNSNLHIVIPVVEHEIETFTNNLELLVENIKETIFGLINVQVYIILQSRFDTIPISIKQYEKHDFISVYMVGFFSVSKARNYGIDLIPKSKQDFVYLLDSDALPGISFFEMIKRCSVEEIPVSVGRIIWERNNAELLKQKSDSVSDYKKKSVNRIINPLLWSYLIRADLLERVRFNEQIGPANFTRIKSGEDVIFFYELININNIKFIYYFNQGYVFHPPRPKDMSKQLLYAEGQGALYRFLFCTKKLTKYQKVHLFFKFILFVGNTFFRVVLFKPKSMTILIKRFNGLFNSNLQKYYD